MKVFLIVFSLAIINLSACKQSQRSEVQADVIIYGGTSAGIIAAVQVARMGKSVIVVSPDKHIGGLSASGLGFTDVGDKNVIGGLSRDFYHRVYQHYHGTGAWNWEALSDFANQGQGTTAIRILVFLSKYWLEFI